MGKDYLKPDYIFESSWEVCNKVGGIYTVLSTRAKTLQEEMKDRILFIGPDFWKQEESPYFKEDKSLFADWQWEAKEQGLKVRVGRWTVPGELIATWWTLTLSSNRRMRFTDGFGKTIAWIRFTPMVTTTKPLCSLTLQVW